jgi:hypothetical protein
MRIFRSLQVDGLRGAYDRRQRETYQYSKPAASEACCE